MNAEILRKYVVDHPDHTLKEISLALGLAVQTVWKWLKRLNITYKKKTIIYRERDEEKRAEFQKKIETVDKDELVYIDEAGVDNRIFREYARAPRGEKIS